MSPPELCGAWAVPTTPDSDRRAARSGDDDEVPALRAAWFFYYFGTTGPNFCLHMKTDTHARRGRNLKADRVCDRLASAFPPSADCAGKAEELDMGSR